MIPYAVPSEDEHVFSLAPRLREADKTEVAASGIPQPAVHLMRGLRYGTECHTVMLAGLPVAMMGALYQDEIRGATVWLLGSPELFDDGRAARVFAKRSKGWASHWLARYRRLRCWPHKENYKHLRWLTWMGFKHIPSPLDDNYPFHYYQLD